MVSKKNNQLFLWGWDRKSDPRNHRLSSLGKPHDANRWSSGRILNPSLTLRLNVFHAKNVFDIYEQEYFHAYFNWAWKGGL